MTDLQTHRRALRISLSAMSRMAGVSRYRLITFELGGGTLRPDEEVRIESALRREAARLASISQTFNLEGAAGA
jgi:predicted transcriptional regulator